MYQKRLGTTALDWIRATTCCSMC